MGLDKENLAPYSVANLRLPPFPGVALKVLRLTRSEDVPLHQLADLISTDAAFTSDVLIVANSYVYSPRGSVKDILQALTALGLNVLNGICLTVGLRSYLGRSFNNPVMRALWRHNLATALVAERIANAKTVNPTVAYTAGILHDVGRFGIGSVFPVQYQQILSSHKGTAASILESERETFGIDHCQLGEKLISDWALPGDYLEAISTHHAEPGKEEGWSLGGVVKVSCLLADAIGFSAFPGCEARPYEEVLRLLPPDAGLESLPTSSEEARLLIYKKIDAIEA